MTFKIGVDDRGEIQYMDAVFYMNDGHSINENENSYSTDSLRNCYDFRRWKVDSFATLTDAPCNVFMRAPGKLTNFIINQLTVFKILYYNKWPFLKKHYYNEPFHLYLELHVIASTADKI